MCRKLASLILVLLFFALPSQLEAARKSADEQLYKDLDLFAKALHFVREHYVEVPDDEKLLYGAIQGMLRTLDPHTAFMPPANYKELQLDTKGHFGGVGIEVTIKDGILTVITPIEGTPASRAGLREGDKIIKINGTSTQDIPLSEAVKLMRGKRGTRVTLTIGREHLAAPFQVTLRRDIIRIQSVRSVEALGDGLAYIRISSFQQDTAQSLEKALRSLETDVPEGLRGLLLDLRNNPGGLLNEAVAVADKFIDKGVIVSTKSRVAPNQQESAHLEGTHPNFPMVILVNGGSASAAEIVAGAMQDHGRAVIFGTSTFGKASVQTVYELGDDVAMKLTVARYYTPKGRSIHTKGISPDVVVVSEPKEVKVEKAVDATDQEEFTIEVEEDPQRQAAVEYLRDWVATGKKGKIKRSRG